jgi:hypothetical protein
MKALPYPHVFPLVFSDPYWQEPKGNFLFRLLNTLRGAWLSNPLPVPFSWHPLREKEHHYFASESYGELG